MQRYFSNQLKNNLFILNDDDIHHIKNVMRMKVNDTIEVVYNKKLYICNIDEINNDIKISIIEEKEDCNELKKHICICFSLVKEEKVNLILQKCTELGINEFIPLKMDRCVVKIDKSKQSKKIDRWSSICKEAAEQSKRNIIPKVNKVLTINDIKSLDYDLKLLCSVKNVVNINKVLQNNRKCDRILIVVGPEGGITPEEEDTLIKNGFISISLGKRVLRTETAPIVISSMINYEYME